jgi:ribose transport system substrate-binding protein
MKLKNFAALAAVSLLAIGSVFAQSEKNYVIGLVAKSQGESVFRPARVGAEQGGQRTWTKEQHQYKIDWRTPNEEDAQKQAEAIEQLVLSGANGIAVSCSDANKLTDAINSAVKMECLWRLSIPMLRRANAS